MKRERWWEQEIEGFPEPKLLQNVGDMWENYPPLKDKMLNNEKAVPLRYMTTNAYGLVGFSSLRQDEDKAIYIYKDARIYVDLDAFHSYAGTLSARGQPNYVFLVKKRGVTPSEFFLDLWMFESQYEIINGFTHGTKRENFIPTRNLYVR